MKTILPDYSDGKNSFVNRALIMVAVIDGSLWRSESGNTRIAVLGSQWIMTRNQFIGCEQTESFKSKSAMLRWMKKNGLSVKFPK